MNGEDFQLKDDEKTAESFLKRDFVKIYQQHCAQVSDEHQSIKFFPGKILKYKQIGHAHPVFEITVGKADNTDLNVTTEITKEVIRLVNNAFAFRIQNGSFSSSFGT